jgi:hypothetical protein
MQYIDHKGLCVKNYDNVGLLGAIGYIPHFQKL